LGSSPPSDTLKQAPDLRKRSQEFSLEAPCFKTIEDTTEADVKRWLIHWPRAIKTKANYHGLLYGASQHAVEAGLIPINPCAKTAPTRNAIRAEAPDHVYLTEPELETLLGAANEDIRDLITVAVGTGLRFGEITALWVDGIDLAHSVLHVNKAWSDDGRDGEQEIPPWLRKRLAPKHTMRRHHLGKPKTAKSRRTVEYGGVVSDAFRRLTHGRANDDFVFVTLARGTSTARRWAGGLPWYQSDFYEGRWVPAPAAARAGRHVAHAFDRALRGGKIERYEGCRRRAENRGGPVVGSGHLSGRTTGSTVLIWAW
jgi:integrase